MTPIDLEAEYNNRARVPEHPDIIAGWQRDAGKLIPPSHRDYAAELADYYITTRLRSSPEEQRRYCPPPDQREESAT